MFNFFKKDKTKEIEEIYFPLTTDIHSHILPGIDDGSPDLETSIELIKGLMKLGVTRSIATPHIIGDMYRNTAETIATALNKLKEELKLQQINYEVSAAAEYMMDGYFFELLQKKVPLLTLKDNIVLTEFSYSSKPENLEQMVFEIFTAGYNPILAHPERYGFYHNDYKQYDRLKELGFLLQVNLLSLTGYYGKEVTKAANYILKNDLATYIGTDLHHNRHMAGLHLPKHHKIFKEMLGHKKWNEI